MRVKICGITQPSQGEAIAQLGATALGFICVPASPRFVKISQIQAITQCLPQRVNRIGVFANTSLDVIVETATQAELTGVQLHGQESPEFCDRLGHHLPQVELIKAIRVKTDADLIKAHSYCTAVNTLLLDAYHPQQLGGTGQTLDWQNLQQFYPPCPWLLAGGLTPDNIHHALSLLHPDGIDLSSGVEHSPGNKDLIKVAQLFDAIRTVSVE